MAAEGEGRSRPRVFPIWAISGRVCKPCNAGGEEPVRQTEKGGDRRRHALKKVMAWIQDKGDRTGF